MMSYLRKRDKGFTLLEVMLVVIIIGIIAIIALPRLLVTKTQAEESSCDSNLQAIRTQLECFEWDNGHYPTGPTTVAGFLDPDDYGDYWPETSAVSADCPENSTPLNYNIITVSNGVNTAVSITCSNHPTN